MRRKQLFITLFSLIISLLIFSCSDPFSPHKLTEPDDLPPMPGMGYVSLSIKVESARTILPDTPAPDTYKIIFTDTTTSEVTTKTLTKVEANAPFAMQLGTYTVTAEAYVGIVLAARGDLTGTLTVTASASTPAAITLKLIEADTDGTFSWNITFPAGVSYAEMEIESLNLTPNSNNTYNLLGASTPHANAGDLTLAAGYYQVTFSLLKAGVVMLIH